MPKNLEWDVIKAPVGVMCRWSNTFVYIVNEEAHGGHAPPPKAHYRGNGKMWAKKTKHTHHPATCIVWSKSMIK